MIEKLSSGHIRPIRTIHPDDGPVLKQFVKDLLLSPPFYKHRQALMDLHEISEITLRDWIHHDYKDLVTENSLAVISIHLLIEPSELITDHPDDE